MPASDEAAAWDRQLVEASNPHLLQSYRWGELQSAFGWEPRRVHLSLSGGRSLPVLMLVAPALFPGARYGYVPKGPALAGTDQTAALWALAGHAREEGLAFLRVEPEVEAGFRPPAGWLPAPATQPENTSIVDLSPDQAELLASFKPKTRYNIRLARKRGVEVQLSDDVAAFAAMSKTTSTRHGIQLASEAYYRAVLQHLGDDARLYLARAEGRGLAGIMVLRFNRRATYLFGASSDAGRELMPAYLLQWQAMLEAKASGATKYDLWGIPPDDKPGHPLAGLWQFKSGWNGRQVAYAGAFDLPLNPLAWRSHRLLSAARVALGSLRH